MSAVKVPLTLQAALVLCGLGTLVFGVVPGLVAKAGELTDLYGALGR
jgi:hypothetical protein